MELSFLSSMIAKGGTVMAILIALSVYVVAVILYKVWQFWQAKITEIDFVGEVVEYVEDKNTPEALRVSANQVNPLARVIEVALNAITSKKMSPEKRDRAISAVGSAHIRRLETHMRGLEMVANISPLLGLLGTVVGMVKAFSSIEQFGSQVDPSMLAGGIWEALLTTVAGLSVAIPALAAHYMLDQKIENFRATMQEAVSLILAKSGS